MTDLYAVLKGLHVSLVLVSGGVFALRGLLAQIRPSWAQWHVLRSLSQWVDTGLLLAALGLLAVLRLNPLGTAWLLAKLGLLVLYITAGHQALNRPQPRRRRWAWYLGALACFVAMLSVAQHHHPLGALRVLLS